MNCIAEEKTWEIDEVVKVGLEKSLSLKNFKENLYKIELDLETNRIIGSMTLNIDGNLNKTWQYYHKPYPENLKQKKDFTIGPRLSIPIYEIISIDMGYYLNRQKEKPSNQENLLDQNEDDKNNSWKKTPFISIKYTPLLYLKKIPKHKQDRLKYGEEKLNFLSSLLQAEIEIRRQYIDSISAIENLNITKRLLNNARELYQLRWEKYKVGLVGQTDVDDALLAKKNAEEQYMVSSKNEYSARIRLSRICDQDMFHAKLAPLEEFKSFDIDEPLLRKSLLDNSIKLKINNQKLETGKEVLKKSRNAYLPDIDLIASAEFPRQGDMKKEYKYEVSFSWEFGYKKDADIEKSKIDYEQAKRGIKNLQEDIENDFNMLIFDFNILKQKLDIQNKLLENQKRILELKQSEFSAGKLHHIELEKYKIEVLSAMNQLKSLNNEMWIAWYRLQMAKTGFI